MSEISNDDYELTVYEEFADDIRKRFRPYEIDAMIRIYRWTKSEKNRYFFTHILKRIQNYKKAIKKLRSEALIQVVKGNDPYKISQDGMLVGGLMLQLKEMKLL